MSYADWLDLLEKFKIKSGEELDNDRVLLS